MGAHEWRGGPHEGASRGRKAALDRATKSGPGNSLFLRCAHHQRVICLCSQWWRLGGGYVLPPREEHFDMLLALQQEFKGAVGFALLNYGAPLPYLVVLYRNRLSPTHSSRA